MVHRALLNTAHCCVAIVGLLAIPALASAEDVIEFLSGAKARGRVTKIDAEGKQVNFELNLAGKTLQRVYPYSSIHAVQYRDKRYVINEMAAPAPVPVSSSGPRERPTPAKSAVVNVDALIVEAGKALPDWYDTTALDYPQSLDLSWPPKPPGGWDSQKNVGQFIWDVINPNPGRWREGVKFMHYMLELHAKNPVQLKRVQAELGRMYCELLQDYARAAYWYRQAGIGKGDPLDKTKNAAHLAECYWRLGNRKMAVDLMNKLPLTYAMIKLWGDIGDTNKCVQLATASAAKSQVPAMNYLIVGDAYRVEGNNAKALAAYQQALTLSQQPPNQQRQQKYGQRADANIKALTLAAAIDLKRIPDGSYRAESIGYTGMVEVEVRVADAKIEEVNVTRHTEKQFYSSIEDTTSKIVKKQGIAGVDATSGATLTSEAIINASAKALASGSK